MDNESDEIKRQARIDLVRLAVFLFQQLNKLTPDERQEFVASLKIPDDLLIEFHDMASERSALKPVFKMEMQKRGIEFD